MSFQLKFRFLLAAAMLAAFAAAWASPAHRIAPHVPHPVAPATQPASAP